MFSAIPLRLVSLQKPAHRLIVVMDAALLLDADATQDTIIYKQNIRFITQELQSDYFEREFKQRLMCIVHMQRLTDHPGICETQKYSYEGVRGQCEKVRESRENNRNKNIRAHTYISKSKVRMGRSTHG